MNAATERQIAWELADHLTPRLSVFERTLVFVDLGSDDFLSVIHRLLHIALCRQLALPPITLERLHLWTRIYSREHEYASLLARIKKTPPR